MKKILVVVDMQEGKYLPVVHCVTGSDGWNLAPEVERACMGRNKVHVPEIKISVIEHACACVTPESHKTAIEAMKTCQVEII